MPAPDFVTPGKVSVTTPYGSATSTQDFYVLPTGVNASSIGTQARIAPDGSNVALSIAAGKSALVIFTANANDNLGLGLTSVTLGGAGSASLTIYDLSGNEFVTTSVVGPTSVPLPTLNQTFPYNLGAGTYTLLIAPQGNTSAFTATLTLTHSVIGSLPLGGAATPFTNSRPGQNGLYTVNATAGSNLTLTLEGCTFPSGVNCIVNDPNGNAIANITVPQNQNSAVDLVGLSAGPYALQLTPQNAGTGTISMILLNDATGTAGTVGGSTTNVTMSSNQHGRFSFSGTANQYLGLGFPTLTTNPTGTYLGMQVFNPDGSELTDCSASSAGSCSLPALPATGTYILGVDAQNSASVNLGILISAAVTGSFTVGGSAATFTTSRVGQDGRYTFVATAGQNLTLSLSNCTFPTGVNGSVLDPNANLVASFSVSDGGSSASNLTNLAAGTYTVALVPNAVSTGHVSMSLAANTSGSAGTINGNATTINLPANESGSYTFNGNANEWVGIGFPTFTTNPASTYVSINILDPNANALADCSTSSPTDCALPQLPGTGTYTMTVSPTSSASLSFQVLLSDELTGTVTKGGSTVTYSTTRVGQGARYTFVATSGESATLKFTGDTFPDGVDVDVFDPTSTLVATFVDQPSDPQTQSLSSMIAGTYTIVITPSDISVGQVSISLQ